MSVNLFLGKNWTNYRQLQLTVNFLYKISTQMQLTDVSYRLPLDFPNFQEDIS